MLIGPAIKVAISIQSVVGNRGVQMGLVRDCRDFNQLWNERLDHRTNGSPAHHLELADHASVCETCRCLGAIYSDFESIPASWPMIPPPSDSVTRRWRAVATSARTISQRPDARRSTQTLAEWGLIAAVAASALVGIRSSLPILFPIDPAPVTRSTTHPSSVLLEEAFSEASMVTWELAREVSAPASLISSAGFGWSDQQTLPPFDANRLDSPRLVKTRDAQAVLATTSQPGDEVEAELTLKSARDAFRFLIGSVTNDSTDPSTVEGF